MESIANNNRVNDCAESSRNFVHASGDEADG